MQEKFKLGHRLYVEFAAYEDFFETILTSGAQTVHAEIVLDGEDMEKLIKLYAEKRVSHDRKSEKAS